MFDRPIADEPDDADPAQRDAEAGRRRAFASIRQAASATIIPAYAPDGPRDTSADG